MKFSIKVCLKDKYKKQIHDLIMVEFRPLIYVNVQ